MLAFTLGNGRFAPPLEREETARADWGLHSGTVNGGMRYHFTPRLAGEAWAGIVIGPHETRVVRDVKEDRVLLSFRVGVGVSYDLIPDDTGATTEVSPAPRSR